MKVQAQDYVRMRAWFAYMALEVFPPDLIELDTGPLQSLDAIASRSPAKAREGLSMAINDLVEMTDSWTKEQMISIDLRLVDAGLPSLTEVRTRFSKLVQRAVSRRRIKDDVEYYAVRNAVELSRDDHEQLWQMMAAYEDDKAS